MLILEILVYFSANLSMLLVEDMLNTTKMGKDLNMTDITELLRPGLRYVGYRHLLLLSLLHYCLI